MITLIFILIFSFKKTIIISPLQYNLFSVGINQIIGFSLIGVFILLISADVWQRAYASSSKKIMKRGFHLAGIILLIFGLAISIVGIVAKNNFPLINSEDALYYGFSNAIKITDYKIDSIIPDKKLSDTVIVKIKMNIQILNIYLNIYQP